MIPKNGFRFSDEIMLQNSWRPVLISSGPVDARDNLKPH